jgi:hypothetical protein
MAKGRVFWRVLTWLAVFAAALVWFFVFTTAGAKMLVRTALSVAFDSGAVRFTRAKGSLSQPLVFYDVLIKDLEGMPAGSVLRIQQLMISNFMMQLENSRIEIRNARLKFPNSDYPVVLSGKYENMEFNMNLYSKSLGVRDTLDTFTDWDLRDISGVIADVDCFLTGSWRQPRLSGSFLVPRFSYRDFSLHDCPVSFDIRFEDIKGGKVKPYGTITYGEALITRARVTVNLLEGGTMKFTGNPKNPEIDFQGTSDIEGVKIRIHLRGTWKKPDLHLASEPALPKDSLLVMLMTGKKWGVSQGPSAAPTPTEVDPIVAQPGQEIPLDVARDFVDFFVFSGAGGDLSKRLGLDNVSMTYNPDSNALGVKKGIADKVELRYGVERPPPGTQQERQIQTHKVGAELKITDTISIDAEGQVREQQPTEAVDPAQDQEQKDGKVVLKYKKKF